ncbi:hypothetical protein GS507_28850 [Rhodococcus hoagii]|nr:hypothetical protein [Prescottella equi]
MSTDNREQQLFPDVIEHYGTDQTPADDAPVSDGLDFPIPAETFAEADAAVFEHDLEPLDVEQDSVVQTDLEPIDAESIIQTDLEPIDAPTAAADAETEQFAAVAPRRTASGPPNRRHPRHTRTALSSTSTNCYPSTPTPTRRTGCAPTFPASPSSPSNARVAASSPSSADCVSRGPQRRRRCPQSTFRPPIRPNLWPLPVTATVGEGVRAA